MESDTTTKVIKKRNKPTLTCKNCKHKKVKCDRGQPCSACVKSKSESSCTYDDRWRSILFKKNINLERASYPKKDYSPEEFDRLRKKVAHLEKLLETSPRSSISLVLEDTCASTPLDITDSDQIPLGNEADSFYLYEGYSSIYAKEPFRRSNFGPLTWLCFMNKDFWLKSLWKYANENDDMTISLYSTSMKKLEQNDISVLRQNSVSNFADNKVSELIFRRRVLEQDGYDEQAPFKLLHNLKPEEFIQQTKNMNPSSIAFAKALFEGKFDAELHLIQKIEIVTPNKKAFWSLIDLFFKNLYPFMPFVDQNEFTSTLTNVFGPISYLDEPIEDIKIHRKLDLAIVAQCLIIIRLTYLSLFSNRDCVNDHIINSNITSQTPDDYKYLLSTPVNLTAIDVAQNCIDTFQFTKKNNLSILQALLYMRICHKLAPEYGDGLDGGDSMISSAILVQMAISLGLNREPDKLDGVCNNQKINHLGRKIWATIVQDSYLHSITNGTPITVDIRNSDVEEPFLNGENSNILDSNLEASILQEFTWIPNKLSFHNFLESVICINKPIQTSSFIAELNYIERKCTEELLTIGEGSRNNDFIVLEIKRAQLFLQIRSSLLSAYFHLFLHYEKSQNVEMSFFLIHKKYTIFYEEFIPYFFEIILGKYSSYGLILIPAIELCLHKSNQLNLYFLARVRYLKLCMERSPQHSKNLNHNFDYNKRYNILINIVENINKVGELTTMAIAKFASRYYHAWRISRAQNLLVNILMKDELYEEPWKSGLELKSFNFSIDQLSNLEQVTNLVSDRLTRVMNYRDSYDQEVPQLFINPKQRESPNLLNTNNSNLSPGIYVPSNENVDKIWLLMLQDQLYPNVVDLDSEFDLVRGGIDLWDNTVPFKPLLFEHMEKSV